jgi:hypothetical protein
MTGAVACPLAATLAGEAEQADFQIEKATAADLAALRARAKKDGLPRDAVTIRAAKRPAVRGRLTDLMLDMDGPLMIDGGQQFLTIE